MSRSDVLLVRAIVACPQCNNTLFRIKIHTGGTVAIYCSECEAKWRPIADFSDYGESKVTIDTDSRFRNKSARSGPKPRRRQHQDRPKGKEGT